ncbi:MAG: hypothetical protein AAB573_02425 [Patescibacteria group bacterium]
MAKKKSWVEQIRDVDARIVKRGKETHAASGRYESLRIAAECIGVATVVLGVTALAASSLALGAMATVLTGVGLVTAYLAWRAFDSYASIQDSNRYGNKQDRKKKEGLIRRILRISNAG